MLAGLILGACRTLQEMSCIANAGKCTMTTMLCRIEREAHATTIKEERMPCRIAQLSSGN